MFTFNYLRRRVSIEHSHGRVSVFIAPGNRQTVYLFALAWFSLGMFFLVSIFIEPLLHSGISRSVLPVLLMFIGIHNAWDVAVWNSVRRQDDVRRADESK